jgi:hypothetical protein
MSRLATNALELFMASHLRLPFRPSSGFGPHSSAPVGLPFSSTSGLPTLRLGHEFVHFRFRHLCEKPSGRCEGSPFTSCFTLL